MSKGKKKTIKFKLLITLLIFALLGGGAFAFYMYTTPQITLEGSKEVTVTMKDGYREPGASASFSFHDISDHIKISSEVNDKKVGTYKVTYSVEYLEKTATATRTVNVIDKEPPEITLIDGDHITVQTASSFEDPGVTAVDDSDGDVTDKVESKGLVDLFNKGDYEIDYKVTDSYGNEASAVRTVTVKGDPAREVKGVIYLTFDDGPSTTVTPKILKTLEKYDVPATFFVIDYGSDPEKISIMKRALKDGCTIGLHGYSHDYSKIYTSTDDFMNNITTLHEKLKTDLDYDPFILRFPGGSSNTVSKDYCKGIMGQLTKLVQKENYYYSDWNVDSTDASGNNVPVKKLIESVEKNCDKDGYNIILMHDSDAKGTTAKALPKIIEWAQEEGYVFKAMTPGSPTVHHRVNN
ncbi:MAG: polysaccharide deacetylase family protein [Firmicutes bacterium]|nr:polysaccharide deacetylase family protein [Bacillota bacterium]